MKASALAALPLLGLLAGCAPPEPESEPVPARAVRARRAPQAAEKPPGGKPSGGPAPVTQIAYLKGAEQVLDLFPSARKGAPLLVFVHGGAWIGGRRSGFGAACRAFSERGFATATVDYRLSNKPSVVHPMHAEDVAAALGWLAVHAKAYGYDPKRIVVVGHSAGAHIAATIATSPRLLALAKRPRAFVGLDGIYDVPKLAGRWPTYPAWFLNAAFGADPAKWAAASPARLPLASRAPWIVVHQRGDELVDTAQSDDFSRHLRKAGVHVEDLRPEGGTHGSSVSRLAEPHDPVADAISRLAGGAPPKSSR